MGKTITVQPTRKEDNKALLIRTLITFAVAVVFVVLLEFALYKFILPQVKEVTTEQYSTTNPSEMFVVDKGDNNNFIYEKTSGGAWSVHKDKTDADVQYIFDTHYEGKTYEDMFHFRAPTAFDITINWVHYVVWAIMIGAIAGYYIYWFIKIKKYYEVHPEAEVASKDEDDSATESEIKVSPEVKKAFEKIDEEAMKKAKAVKSATTKTSATKTATTKTAPKSTASKTTKPKTASSSTAKTTTKPTAKTAAKTTKTTTKK